MNIQWDSEDYKKSFSFVHKYGKDLTELITLPKGSFVCDLGCGGGQLTSELKNMGYDVIGIDASENMLETAKRSYPDIDFRFGDALDFKLGRKADGIFSNAVFHWISAENQNAMIKNIAENLRHGGQLVCEFGGKGCAETVHSALEKIFNEKGLVYTRDFFFPTIGEYAPLLERHGLRVVYASLFDRPTPQEKGISGWIKMFDKKPFENLSPDITEEIIARAEKTLSPVLMRSGTACIDYVRIRIKAVRL